MSSFRMRDNRPSSQLLRRFPSAHELSSRTPIVLTERDRSLLLAVHKFGLLTTDLIELAFFADTGRTSHCSRAYQRVRDLWLWGFLERVELPAPRSLGGRRPFVYALGAQGQPVIEARNTARTPVQQRRLDRLDFAPIDHDLQAASLWANVLAETRRRGLRPPVWMGERELRGMQMRAKERTTDRWLPVVPDGHVELWHRDGSTQRALVEIDAGTLTLRRFALKVRAFELALMAEVFQKRFGWDHSTEVWILTTSDNRLESLRATAARVVDPERYDSYFLATFEALEPDCFADWPWLNLDGDSVSGVL